MKYMYKFGLIVIKDNKVLLCQPYSYNDLIVPGGLRRENESYKDNLIRQVREELGYDAFLDSSTLKYLGNFTDRAAGITDRQVEIELYYGEVSGTIKPSSEIKDCYWFSPSDDYMRLSPIIRNKILPFLIEENYLVNEKCK